MNPMPLWYALYTKSRHEKFIQNELNKRSIESFLPVRVLRKHWSDRTVSIEEPLFKSYLFVKTDLLNRCAVLKAKGAVRFVAAGAQPISISECIIEALKTAVREDIPLDPFPYLKQGDRVYVRSGLFKGTEGFIVRKDGKKSRLVISIDALMTSVSVEIDAGLAEKI